MKRILLFMTLAIASIMQMYSATDPMLIHFKSDFSSSTPVSPLGDFTCFGNGKTSADVEVGMSGIGLRQLFPVGAKAYIPIDIEGFGIIYCSNSSTVEGGPVDQWLVTPAINLSGAPENIMLAFDAIAYGSSKDSKIEVYMSTTGNTPEDFTSGAIYKGKMSNSVSAPVSKRIYKSIKNPGSETVYLAFVNKSTDAQILGFRNIVVSDYDLEIDNPTPAFISAAGDVMVSMTVGLMTPVPCDGFKAVLSVAGMEDQVFTTSKQLGSSFTTTEVTFDTPIPLEYGDDYNYTVTLTPAYEGAKTAVIEGSVSCAKGYPAMCVEEEATGVWCGYCVRGIAALARYTDLYPDRFIGIAVHSGNKDPMVVPSYQVPLLKQSGIGTFPNAWFNRRIMADPADTIVINSMLDRVSGYNVTINKVFYDPKKNLMSVTYSPEMSFPTTTADITAAVVVTEDHVKGNKKLWSQVNYYSGATEKDIDELFGEGFWPYFKPFCEGDNVMSYERMEYDHVAQCIFNDYYGGGAGGKLPAEWKAFEPQEFTMSFELPLQKNGDGFGVQNWLNTHTIVLLIDRVSGEILNAAKMSADQYEIEGAAGIDDNVLNAEVGVTDGYISIATPGHAVINIYTPAGYRLHTCESDGEVIIDGSRWGGVVIVHVTSGNVSFVKKVVL